MFQGQGSMGEEELIGKPEERNGGEYGPREREHETCIIHDLTTKSLKSIAPCSRGLWVLLRQMMPSTHAMGRSCG